MTKTKQAKRKKAKQEAEQQPEQQDDLTVLLGLFQNQEKTLDILGQLVEGMLKEVSYVRQQVETAVQKRDELENVNTDTPN